MTKYGTALRATAVFVAWIFIPEAAVAAFLQLAEPLGAIYEYRIPSQTVGPLQRPDSFSEKIFSGTAVAGVEYDLQNGAVRVGGWAYHFREGNSGGFSRYEVEADFRIVAEPGEAIGDPVVLYVHVKSYLEGDSIAQMNYQMDRLQPTFRNSVLFETFCIGSCGSDSGWTRNSFEFSASVGDVFRLKTSGVAAEQSGARPAHIVDGLVQFSFSDVEPPDPPIAAPVAVPALGTLGAALLILGLLCAGRCLTARQDTANSNLYR